MLIWQRPKSLIELGAVAPPIARPIVFGGTGIAMALFDHLTHQCEIVEIGGEPPRFKNRA